MRNKSIQCTRCAVLAAASLLLPASAFGQTVIGSWQTSSGDGWIDWGNGLSITDGANTNKYGFASGAVSGYARSLVITQAGWGQSLAIKLQNNGYVDDFLNNQLLSFTFSVPSSAESGATAGFSEINQVILNSPAGFTGLSWTNGLWSYSGDTGANQSGMPNFYFWDGSPAQSQTVTLDYSSLLAAMGANPGWIEIVFTFNGGGGAPDIRYVNNVVLSSSGGPLVLYPFNSADDVPGQYYPWNGWFGAATDLPEVEWDASDANGDPNSGSMKLNTYWPNAGYFGVNDQFVIHNSYNGLDLFFGTNFWGYETNGMPCFGNTMTNYVVTNISFDLRFDPASVYYTNSGNWPGIEIGTRGNSQSQYTFGTATIPHSNTNWVHFSFPIGPSPDWALSHSLYFKHYSTTLNGEMDCYVDNITVEMGEIAQPILALEKARPGLRVFAGSSGIYDRQQLHSVNANQSWVGGGYPASYSFTLSDYGQDPALGQVHLFLIPVDHVNGGLGNINGYTDYSYASNNLWLQIVGGESNVTANISWKTNKPNANPDQIALQITNATAVGEWKLTFTSASGGTLTAPGASPVGFTIDDPNVATDFDNPLVVFCGIQPNSTEAIGQHVDFARIQTVGVAFPGVPIDTDFTTSGGIDTNVWSTGASMKPSSLVHVNVTEPWWLTWNLVGDHVLTTRADLGDDSVTWKTPAYFTGQTGTVFQAQMGPDVWALIPQDSLPTTDGTSNGVPGSAAFFRLQNPGPAE